MPVPLSALGRFLHLIAVAGVMLAGASRAQAQQPPMAPPAPDLEKRVRELEEMVHRMQAERAPTPAIPTVQTPVPPTAENGNPMVSSPGAASPAGDGVPDGGDDGASSSRTLAGWTDKNGF